MSNSLTCIEKGTYKVTSKKRSLFSLEEAIIQAERDSIIAALEQTKGNRIQAAKILGISRKSLWKKMRELNIDFPKKK